MYSERSKPPNKGYARRSAWRRAFDEARRDQGTWRRVLRPLAMTSARQVASDVRCGRQHLVQRFSLQPGEVWETRFGQQGDDWYVWIRLASQNVSLADRIAS
jgi:hypothetical protein